MLMNGHRRVLSGHPSPPTLVSLSGDSSRIVSTCADRRIRVWDVASGALTLEIDSMDKGTRQPVMVWSLSSDGRFLATGAPDFTTKILDLDRGGEAVRLSPLKTDRYNSAEQLAFSADGTLLASAKGRTIEIFDRTSGTWSLQHTLTGHTSKAHLLRFVPGTPLLVSASGKLLKLWDAAAGKELATLTGHGRLLASIAVSQDGQFLASGDEGGVLQIWSLPAGEPAGRLKTTGKQLFWTSFGPRIDRVITGGLGGTVWLADRATLRTIATCPVPLSVDPSGSADGGLFALSSEQGDVLVVAAEDGALVARLPDSRLGLFAPTEPWLLTAEGNDLVIRTIAALADPAVGSFPSPD
jgi:WD40 repeat protein